MTPSPHPIPQAAGSYPHPPLPPRSGAFIGEGGRQGGALSLSNMDMQAQPAISVSTAQSSRQVTETDQEASLS